MHRIVGHLSGGDGPRGVAASPAQAAFHLNMVNGLMLASAGEDAST
jgi:hypothetical protein